LLIEGRITMTGSSYCFYLATSMTFTSISSTLSFPKTSNYSFLSGSVASDLITTVLLRKAFILLSPRSPLKVAVIPISLYLFMSRIAERNRFLFIVGASEKNRESISSIKTLVPKGIFPVRTSE
jgi:hypothetical protein